MNAKIIQKRRIARACRCRSSGGGQQSAIHAVEAARGKEAVRRLQPGFDGVQRKQHDVNGRPSNAAA